uniref:Cytochrome c oxidase subunit VIIa-related protein, mitochondrial n=1 Tax=Scolopendra viridis TaxID=118503 RepID=A0A4D5R9C8_SCOVI
MFYRFNTLTNRLISATHMQAYQPQGLVPLSKVTSQKITMLYHPAESGPALANEAIRQTSSTPLSSPPRKSSKYAPLNPRIKELQELFQKDDGVPVHLKRGGLDRILYYTTGVLTAAGTCWVLYDIVITAMPH